MIVFPMAGLSSRFAQAGYDKPKWMLPLAGRPLLDWSLMSFAERFTTEQIVIVFIECNDIRSFVRSRVNALGMSDTKLVGLSNPTRGQAETVNIALDILKVPPDMDLTIFNVDTIRPHCRIPTIGLDGWVECFSAPGDSWSFVLPDKRSPELVAQIVEKRRISDLCCTGVYYFSTVGLFQMAYKKELADPSAAELFVAPMYRHIIASGGRIGYGIIAPDQIINSGTPDDYERAKRMPKEALLKAFSVGGPQR